MAYKEPEEAQLTCMKCGKRWGISTYEAQHGLFRNGELLRCSRCFEEMKHAFWLERMERG